MQEKGNHRLSFVEKLSYGFGDCAANVYVAVAGTFLSAFYTDTVGIAVAAVGPIMSGIFAMTTGVVDYGEWKTGIRSEGLVNSCTSFGMKVGIGLGSAVGSAILAMGSYLEGTAPMDQPASAIASIKFAFGFFGAIISAIVLVLIILMNIDKNIKQIQADLEKKHAQAK